MVIDPFYGEVAAHYDRDHNDGQDHCLPVVVLACIPLLCLCPVIHPLTAFCRKSVDQHDDNDCRDHHVCAKTSLDAEARIVEDAVTRRCGFEFEDRILGHNAAVGQAEHDALREVPGCVCPDHRPKAVPVVDDQGEQNADQKDLQETKPRHARI